MNDRGHGLVELIVVVAIAAILFGAAAPVAGAWRAIALRAGAEEVAAALGTARQLAIKENTTVCVTTDGSRLQYRVAGCASAAWTGPGTDAAGFVPLATGMRVTAPAHVSFSYLGDAVPAGRYIVRHPADGATLDVVVAATGHVSITR